MNLRDQSQHFLAADSLNIKKHRNAFFHVKLLYIFMPLKFKQMLYSKILQFFFSSLGITEDL